MKLAVITDSSAVLSPSVQLHSDLHVLDIPVVIDGVTYLEENITDQEFYAKMAASKEFPTTSQPSLLELETILFTLQEQGYTHVIGLFLSSGISGFWQNIQYLADEFPQLKVAFPDSKITSVPLGVMVEKALQWSQEDCSFEVILERISVLTEQTKAFIMVDDLSHLVKGGRLSNGAAILGTLLKIKPILHFTNEGKIEVYEKVRTEKKASKRMVDIIQTFLHEGEYDVYVIHAHALEKAQLLADLFHTNGVSDAVAIEHFGAVIGTHLGAGALAVGVVPVFK